MIVLTHDIKHRIRLANTPEKFATLLHELFMQASYGSKFHNLLGLASKMNEAAIETNDRQLFENIRSQLIDSLKFPILFL